LTGPNHLTHAAVMTALGKAGTIIASSQAL
jgi:hypothetical protein